MKVIFILAVIALMTQGISGMKFLRHKLSDEDMPIQEEGPCGNVWMKSDSFMEEFLANYSEQDQFSQLAAIGSLSMSVGAIRGRHTLAILQNTQGDIQILLTALTSCLGLSFSYTPQEVIDIEKFMIDAGSGSFGGDQFAMGALGMMIPLLDSPSQDDKDTIIGLFSDSFQQMQVKVLLYVNIQVQCFFGAVPEDTVAFVFDISGSMNYRISPDDNSMKTTRLDLLKQQLQKTIMTQLTEDQLFNIFPFSSRSYQWQDEYVYATLENKQAAVDYIEQIKTVGATNISGALKRAFGSDSDLKAIYLQTDGFPNYGVQDPADVADFIEQEQSTMDNQVAIHCIGLFLGGKESDDDKQKAQEFLQAIADASDGSFEIISDEAETDDQEGGDDGSQAPPDFGGFGGFGGGFGIQKKN